MNADQKENDVYKRLAEAVLQNQLLSERLTMMTRMCSHYMEMRAELCLQLEPHGLGIAINNQLVKLKQ